MGDDYPAAANGAVRAADSGNAGQLAAESAEARLDIARTWHA